MTVSLRHCLGGRYYGVVGSLSITLSSTALALVASGVLATAVVARVADSRSSGTSNANCERDLQNHKPCVFQLGDGRFEVTERGNGRRMSSDGAIREFDLEPDATSLPLTYSVFGPGKNFVERVCFGEYQGDPLIVVGLTDGWNRSGSSLGLGARLGNAVQRQAAYGPFIAPPVLFGWEDVDGDRVPEILDSTPYGRSQ